MASRADWFASPLTLKAVDGASFTLRAAKTLAVVGESGCGKSTLARMVTMIERTVSGSLVIEGVDVATASPATLKQFRREVQIVFQDPYGSLNPRQKIGTILEEPLVINEPTMTAVEHREAAVTMMERVGLRPEHYERYPHMFSGGQRQRIAIARALMLRPKILVLDEPVSALDLSVQAQVLNLLIDLQREFGLAYLFISHGLSVVRHIADDVMVMYLGRPVEQGRAKRSSPTPAIPIRGRCSRPRRSPIRPDPGNAFDCRANCRRRSIRQAGARSIPAVRWRSIPVRATARIWRPRAGSRSPAGRSTRPAMCSRPKPRPPEPCEVRGATAVILATRAQVVRTSSGAALSG